MTTRNDDWMKKRQAPNVAQDTVSDKDRRPARSAVLTAPWWGGRVARHAGRTHLLHPMTRAFVPIALLVAAGTAAAQPADSGGRLWPVPLAPAVSSNFCEYRDGRFHAGIDVRTGGREGVACRAVADGSVTRMRAGSLGYGKALHVTLADGDEAVYAHLAEFMPALEESLGAAQRREGRYHVDVRFAPGALPVRRGDVIAYSGATGTAGPHLHFETRDGDVAVNPFRRGFAVRDRERPSFTHLALVPLDPGARVEGACHPLELRPRRTGPGRYAIPDTLHLAGRVGVAAGVIDRLNSASGRLAPYEMEVWADDSLVAHIVLERIPFSASGEADLLYHAGANRARGVAFFELYPRDGESLEGRRFPGGGSLLPGGGPARVHRGRVVARDVAGNAAELSFLYVDAGANGGGSGPAWSGPRAPNLAPDIDGAFFVDGFAQFPLRAPRRVLRERGHDATHAQPADSVALLAADLTGQVEALLRTAGDDTATVYVTAFARGVAAAAVFPALGLGLAVAPDALYGDVVTYATRAQTGHAAANHGLVRVTEPVRVGPVGWVSRRGFDVRIEAPASGERDAIFRFDDRRRAWSYLATGARDAAGITARSTRPGVFAVLRDTTPPWLGAPELAWPQSYFTGAPYPEIRVPVEDRGAGIDDTRIAVTVGGVVRYARWDFAKKIIVVPLRGESIIGPQPVHVVVYDKVGNESVADATLTFETR